MPQLEIPAFTIPQVIDTVYIAKYFEPNFLSKYGFVIGPGIAALIAIAGWFAVAWLTRKNQVRQFEEALLDKIRLELREPLNEFKDWLGLIRKGIAEMYIPDDERVDDPDLIDQNPDDPVEIQTKRTLELNELLNNDLGAEFFSKYREYSGVFPNLKPAALKIREMNLDMLMSVSQFISFYHYFLEENSSESIVARQKEILAQIRQVQRLRNEFTDFFNYECLKVLQRVTSPHFPDKGFKYLSRGPDGKVSVTDSIVASKREKPPLELSTDATKAPQGGGE